MVISHRIALDPNNVQATYFAKAAGVARFTYNWALSQYQQQYKAHKADPTLPKPSVFALSRRLNAIKREQFPWMLEVTSSARDQAILQLDNAFRNFFAGRARYPKFRKKGRADRFTLSNQLVTIDGCRIRIPKLGWVRMREPLRFAGKIMSVTISRVTNRWFASIAVAIPDNSHLPQAESQGVVGVDLGVSALATLSTGEVITGPKPYRRLLGRVRRLSRSLSRKQKGSANRAKVREKLAKLHARIAAIRQDALHKLTTDLTRRFCTVVVENLNARGMLKNRYLARSISDMGFYEFQRQLEYKAAMRGGQVVVADRFFASSKTCSACGHKLEVLPLSVREWTCPACGVIHDRDVNAAINLRNMAASSAVSACGEEGSGLRRKRQAKPSSAKQEASFTPAHAG
jgi:putative transposase